MSIQRTDRPVFIDIDGTLTATPSRPWGPVIPEHLERVRQLVSQGYQVVLWTGGGTKYARAFAKKHDLPVTLCTGKPEACVDDNPHIRPPKRMRIISPAAFFGNPT